MLSPNPASRQIHRALTLGIAGWIAAAATAPQEALALCPPEDSSSQSKQPQTPQSAVGMEPVAAVKPAPSLQAVEAEKIKARLASEREMKKIRAKHFGSMQNQEIRQVGIDKLRQFADVSLYPSLLSIYERENPDVLNAVLDIFADARTEQGDASITWAAVKSPNPALRDLAAHRLAQRSDDAGGLGNLSKVVIESGLKSPSETEAGAAAQLCEKLRLYEAIPAMINAQVRGAPGGGGGGGVDVPLDGSTMGSIADIMIATQQAFVADLTPVVGDSAVGFDPTLGVVTEGTYLRIMGASVITYRTVINNALIGLANAGWDGRSTASLGWDAAKWRFWYANEFKPYRAKVEAEAAAKREQATIAKP